MILKRNDFITTPFPEPFTFAVEMINSMYKYFIIVMAFLLAGPMQGFAQVKNARKETVHIYGNCGMCESTIEKSALKKGIAEADWDRTTKKAVITYDSTKTTIKEVMKRIADAGYDNDYYTAPDDVYAKLHSCCQYDRKPQ